MITSYGIGISDFLVIRDMVVPFFVGSGTKICHVFGIKDQKFGYKNGASDENTYLVTTLIIYVLSHGNITNPHNDHTQMAC